MTIRDDGEISLCPVRVGELDTYAYWMTHGEWRHFDAPWDGVDDKWEPEAFSRFRERFLNTAARQEECVSKCTLRFRGEPIGWVSSYGFSYDKTSAKVGICICLDSCLGKGLGTRSMLMWTDYWFEDRKIHRLGLETWSFHARMIRVAGRCGFVAEGVEREVLRWNGSWLDLHHFGMTEDEHARAKAARGRVSLGTCRTCPP